MSSIYGKLNFNKKHIELGELAAMKNALNHWEADNKGQWHSNAIGLGQLMLYNTPESLDETLPLYNAISGLTITADARIDNRDELFAKLYNGHADKALIADSVLIMKAYEKYGENCVLHLIGDFAFCIWDEREKKIFCARDHMGVKPFFYYRDAYFFAFASEKKGLLCLPDLDKTINEQFFYNQLIFQPMQAVDTTLYEKIMRIPPAHTLTVKPDGSSFRLAEYWTLDATLENKLAGRDEYIEGIRHHFEQAVHCRSRSAYPIGAELSGGIDSSAITGVADRFLKNQDKHLITFSNTLPDGITDEELLKGDARKLIDAVIAFNDIKEYVYITKQLFDDPLDEIDFNLKINDGLEKFNASWQLPSKKAAMERGVRTLFSGFPGDQMITTRAKDYFLDLLDKKKYREYLLAPKRFNSQFNKIRPFIPGKVTYGLLQIANHLGYYVKNIRISEEIFNIPAAYKIKYKDMVWEDSVFCDIYSSYRHSQKYTLLKPQSSQRMEGESRMGLYFKLEPRFPMADIRLTQFFLAMPNEIKYGGLQSRPSFRAAMKNYLPPEVLTHDSKRENNAPFTGINKEKRIATLDKLLNDLPDIALFKKSVLLNSNLQSKQAVQSINTINNIGYSIAAHRIALRWLADKKNLALFKKPI